MTPTPTSHGRVRLVHTQLEHKLEKYNEEAHAKLLYAAMLDGVDVSPMVGGAERYIGYGATKHGYGPACIMDLAGTEYVAEPHVTWFPWTSPGNRIVNFNWAMKHLAQTREVFLAVEKSQMKFFEHFVKKGVLRKVGHLENLPIVEEVHMYQFRRTLQ